LFLNRLEFPKGRHGLGIAVDERPDRRQYYLKWSAKRSALKLALANAYEFRMIY